MRCSRCGANVVEGDRFCENCGAPVAVQAGPVCTVCGQQSEPGMRFCQQCGAELSAGPQPAQPVPTAQPVPPAQPYQAVQQYAGQYGAAQPGAVFPPQAAKDDKPCTAAPDAELSSVDHSDANLVAQLQLTSNCASTKDSDTAEFKESDVKVSIKDDDGNVIASAVFDFSKRPVKFNGETANVALEFTTRQYWRPYDQIETGSAEVILQTGQSGTGEAGSADGDALAGSDIDSEDAERYAQLALSWQLKRDESAASRFYTTYTTQLSSKKNDMKADGKTWHYVDIYEQFLQQRIKHKNAILIWSGDYPTYTKADASTAYYVILSGDTVDSVKAGDAWCKSNGYGAADCAVVDLQ